MEKIERQMEDDQLGQQMVTTPTPTKPKPYTQVGESQKTKIINQHLKPTRYIVTYSMWENIGWVGLPNFWW